MKKILKKIIFPFILLFSAHFVNAQSKNKQILTLEFKIDSVKKAILAEDEWIKKQLDMKSTENKELKTEIQQKQEKIDSLNILFKSVNAEFNETQTQLLKEKNYKAKIELDITSLNANRVNAKSDQPIETTQIGTQIWALRPIAFEHFSNGDSIAVIASQEDWLNALRNRIPACCSINFDTKNDSIYGKLYNWFVLSDPRRINPYGFEIPNLMDFQTLHDFVETNKVESVKSNLGWIQFKGNNKFKFNCTPSGLIDENGEFGQFGEVNYYWLMGDSSMTKCSVLKKSDVNFYLRSSPEKNIGIPIRFIVPKF